MNPHHQGPTHPNDKEPKVTDGKAPAKDDPSRKPPTPFVEDSEKPVLAPLDHADGD